MLPQNDRMCVQIAISHVSQTLWERECSWHFQLTANSCFWVMSTTAQAALVVFFFFFFGCSLERGKLQKIAVCHSKPDPAVKHSLVSCSKTWCIIPGIQLQWERPSSCCALWGSQLYIHRSAHFTRLAHYFRSLKEKRKCRPTSARECLLCAVYYHASELEVSEN